MDMRKKGLLRNGKDGSSVRGRLGKTLLVEGIREESLDISHGCKIHARNELILGTSKFTQVDKKQSR